jgi:hypothetical protein
MVHPSCDVVGLLMRPGWRCVRPAGSGLAACARGRGWHGLSCGTERSTIHARLPLLLRFLFTGDLGFCFCSSVSNIKWSFWKLPILDLG